MAPAGDDAFAQSPDEILCKCKKKALQGPSCVTCGRVFHPACAERYKKCCNVAFSVNDPVTPDLASESASTIAFLQSPSFTFLISNIVKAETSVLRNEIAVLRNEINILRESNIDMIKLMSSTEVLQKPRYAMVCNGTPAVPLSVPLSVPVLQTSPGAHVNKNDIKPGVSQKNVEANRKQQQSAVSYNNTTATTIPPSSGSQDMSMSMSGNTRPNRDSQNRRRKRSYVTGTGHFENSTLKSAPRNAYIYVGNFDRSSKTEDVVAHLKRKYASHEFKVDQLPMRDQAKSVSFKITADASLETTLLNDSSLWPSGVRVKRFIFLRERAQKSQEGKSDHVTT